MRENFKEKTDELINLYAIMIIAFLIGILTGFVINSIKKSYIENKKNNDFETICYLFHIDTQTVLLSTNTI